MAHDTPVNPEEKTPAAEAVSSAVPDEPALGHAVGAMEVFMNLLRNIDKKVTHNAEKIQEQWDRQKDLYDKSLASFAQEEEFRALLKIHIGDMADMRRIQKESNEKTEQLSNAQDRLADALEHINDNLKNGFSLGNAVVRLFGKITFVFLAAVVVLCLVIIWVARLDMTHEDDKGNKTTIRSKRVEATELPPAPSVDLTAQP